LVRKINLKRSWKKENSEKVKKGEKLLQDVSRIKNRHTQFQECYTILMTTGLSESIDQNILTNNDLKNPMKTSNID